MLMWGVRDLHLSSDLVNMRLPLDDHEAMMGVLVDEEHYVVMLRKLNMLM
jgi:hypothetical protein